MVSCSHLILIIEPKWNVNNNAKYVMYTIDKTNNRTKVECKFFFNWKMFHYFGYLIIEPKWNVNMFDRFGEGVSDALIIEPKWNVNLVELVIYSVFDSLIIEPKWNVN